MPSLSDRSRSQLTSLKLQSSMLRRGPKLLCLDLTVVAPVASVHVTSFLSQYAFSAPAEPGFFCALRLAHDTHDQAILNSSL